METFTGLRHQDGVPVVWISSPKSCLGTQFLLREFLRLIFDLLKVSKTTISFHFSSIVYEVIRTISSLFIFFSKKILSTKKAPKRKETIFTLLEVIVHAENGCLYCLVFACFCFISWFLLVTCFCAFKIFSGKKKNKQT